MASAARDLRYRSNYGVDGSLARDLDWAVRERELQHAGEAPRHQEQVLVREQPKEQTRTHVRVRERQQVSMVSVAGFAAVIAMVAGPLGRTALAIGAGAAAILVGCCLLLYSLWSWDR